MRYFRDLGTLLYGEEDSQCMGEYHDSTLQLWNQSRVMFHFITGRVKQRKRETDYRSHYANVPNDICNMSQDDFRGA